MNKILAISYLKQINFLDDKSRITSYIPFKKVERFDIVDNSRVELVLSDKTILTLNYIRRQEDLEKLINYIYNTKETIIDIEGYINKLDDDENSSDSDNDEDQDN